MIKDIVGEWCGLVCVQGTGDKIGGRLGFWGFISIGSGKEHKIVFRNRHMTSVNAEMKGSPEEVIPSLQGTPAV